MKLNIIANAARTQNGEALTVEMLKAELAETKLLLTTNPVLRRAKDVHIRSLKAAIKYKENHKQIEEDL